MIDPTILEQFINFSPSCERNKAPILVELLPLVQGKSSVLEIGSYSAQHALHFARQMPHITWQPTDIAQNLAGLNHNLALVPTDNITPAVLLNVSNPLHWPQRQFDLIYTANTLHIMAWQSVVEFISQLPKVTKLGSTVVIYGPFKYHGQFTSPSNQDFDNWLKERDPLSGVRDFEQIQSLFNNIGFSLISDTNMPANNQLLVFGREF
ncbi:DUF938 domain-containing protein [Colwellia sp. MEBiC06753]